jgi:glycosyltransferase 2 family protein
MLLHHFILRRLYYEIINSLFMNPLFQTGLKTIKPYLRWVVLGATLFFIAAALKTHWQEVVATEVNAASWACLVMALGVTLLAHIWSGWVWHWILQSVNIHQGGVWGVQVYLKTNIAKYLPGNVWHFYGRVRAVQALGVDLGTSILSVVLEPLLMAASALMLAILSDGHAWVLRLAILAVVLVGVHPKVLNPLLKKLTKSKLAQTPPHAPMNSTELEEMPHASTGLTRYPWQPLLGEFGFVSLRGVGFVLALLAFEPLTWGQVPVAMSAFGLAWLLGLVIPGAPGGIGVFEAAMIALLDQTFAPGALLGSIAAYRLVNTLAEAGGAGLIWLDSHHAFLPKTDVSIPPGQAMNS